MVSALQNAIDRALRTQPQERTPRDIRLRPGARMPFRDCCARIHGRHAKPSAVQLDTSSFLARNAMPIVLAYLVLGASAYALLEGWRWSDGLYFSVVTLTTVGYGDMAPSTNAGKAFSVAYILLGLSLVASSLAQLFANLQFGPRGQHLREALLALGCLVVVAGFGAVTVSLREGWGALDSIYWAVVTCSSVGYGDLRLTQSEPAARTFMAVYILLGVGCFAASLGKLGQIIMDATRAGSKGRSFSSLGTLRGSGACMEAPRVRRACTPPLPSWFDAPWPG